MVGGTATRVGYRAPALALAGALAVLPTVLAGSAPVAGTFVGTVVVLLLAVVVASAVALLVLTHLPVTPGPADAVTAARVALTAGLAGHLTTVLISDSAARTWWIACLAAVAAALDAVDGRVARRTGTASEAGARFDMQADAAFVAVLAVALVPVAGPFVLLAGGARYGYAVAARFRAALRDPLPCSRIRRGIAASQAAATVLAVVPVVPVGTVRVVLALSVAAVLWSFARDVVGAERRRRAHERSSLRGTGAEARTTAGVLVATAGHQTSAP